MTKKVFQLSQKGCTIAQIAEKCNIEESEVKEILGHEKLDTTMIYAKISHDSVKFNHKRYIV